MITKLVDNLGAAIGCRFLNKQNKLIFVEYSRGRISVLDMICPLDSVVSQGTTVLKGTWIFDCETGSLGGDLSGPGDIWWEQIDNVKRQMVPVGGASLINLGKVNFASITPAILQSLVYSNVPIPGNNDSTNQLVNNDVFAVRTRAGNVAKIRVVNYGYNMNIEWVTYKIASPYHIIGTGYTTPEDIAITRDEKTAYVTERTGNLLKVALNNANRAAATVVATGMTAPQQIYLDEQRQQAYVVEYANPGRLIRIDLNTGQKIVLLNGLNKAIGLLISSDLAYAYISEQSGGGRITRYSLQGGAPLEIASGLINPFFLTWMDPSQTAMFVAERDPANRITIVETVPRSGSVRHVINNVGMRPSSVACIDSSQLLICCDREIDKANLLSEIAPPIGLFKGIGLVPPHMIVQGKADTKPEYPYQFPKDSPFGGKLSLQINHMLAWLKGARFYRVLVDGKIRRDTWSDFKLNTTSGKYDILVNVAPVNQDGYYPIHDPNEYYKNTDLGMIIDSTTLKNGLLPFKIEYYTDNAGNALKDSGGNALIDSLPVMIDNNRCTASIEMPIVGGVTAPKQCGMYKFTDKTQKVTIHYVASHPSASHPSPFAKYSWRLGKAGVGPVPSVPECKVDGDVKLTPFTFEKEVGALLETCPSAAFYAHVYVSAMIINGYSRQSQYDASTILAFALTP